MQPGHACTHALPPHCAPPAADPLQRDIVEFRNSEVAKSKADADALQEALDKLGEEIARWGGAGAEGGLGRGGQIRLTGSAVQCRVDRQAGGMGLCSMSAAAGAVAMLCTAIALPGRLLLHASNGTQKPRSSSSR